jgi:hypothetical protein
MTFYLPPLPLPSTQLVVDLAYLLKKGRVERSMLTTFDLWKGQGRSKKTDKQIEGMTFLYIECVKFHPWILRSIKIVKDQCRRLDL